MLKEVPKKRIKCWICFLVEVVVAYKLMMLYHYAWMRGNGPFITTCLCNKRKVTRTISRFSHFLIWWPAFLCGSIYTTTIYQKTRYHYVVSNISYLNVWNTYSRYKSKMMVFDILAFVNIMVWKSISSCILQIISHRNNNLTSSTCWWWPRTLDSFQTGAQHVLLTFRTLGSIKVFI